MMKKWLFFLCLCGCSPTTSQDIRLEGEAQTRKLAWELKQIETKEQLQEALPKIKKKYNQIAALLLEARELKQQFGQDFSTEEPSLASEELFVELARLYEVPGARELLESAQGEAIRKLDTHKKTR